MKPSLFLLISLALAVLPAAPLQAKRSVIGGTAQGAVRGAILGAIVGGESGAKRGAAIGGAIGLIRTAEQKEREREIYRQEQLSLERERLALEQERLRLEQAIRPSPPPAGVPASADASLIRDIQRSLIVLGLFSGPVDGLYSPQLATAINQFQTRLSLPVTGVPDASLLSHLRANGG